MRSLPYYKRYPSDALRGAQALTLAQRGAHATIVDLIYENGGPIADRERSMCAHLNCDPRVWRRVRSELIELGKIYVTVDGMIGNDRADIELKSLEHLREVRAISGTAGGRKTARNSKNTNENNDRPPAIAKQVPEICSSSRAPPEPESESDRESIASLRANSSPKGNARRRSPETPVPDDFPSAGDIADAQARMRQAGVDLDAALQAERFRNHASQVDRRCRDWRAAWRNWVLKAIEGAPKKASVSPTASAPAAAATAWHGPAELWSDVVAKQGEAWAMTWLHPCGWQDAPSPTIICPRDLTRQRLEIYLGPYLSARNIDLVVDRPRAA